MIHSKLYASGSGPKSHRHKAPERARLVFSGREVGQHAVHPGLALTWATTTLSREVGFFDPREDQATRLLRETSTTWTREDVDCLPYTTG